MFNRRKLFAGAMSVPLVASGIRSASAQSSIEELDVGEASILGISPDASILVGRLNQDQLTFIDAESLKTISTTDAIPEMSHLEEGSISWNPAGTHIALNLESWLRMVDSDIFIVEATTGDITNLTPEADGEVAARMLQTPDALIDLYPVWMDDETLMFGRHQFRDDSIAVGLNTLSLPDGTPEEVLDLAAEDIQYVSSPLHRLSDDRLVTVTDTTDRRGYVSIIDLNGSIDQIAMPFETRPDLIGANDTHSLVVDPAMTGNAWMVPYNESAAAMTIHDVFELEPFTQFQSIPIFGPAPDSVLFVAGSDPTVMIRDTDGVHELGLLPEDDYIRRSYWVGNTAILAGSNTTWRVNTA